MLGLIFVFNFVVFVGYIFDYLYVLIWVVCDVINLLVSFVLDVVNNCGWLNGK